MWFVLCVFFAKTGYSEEEDEETGAEYITLYGNESNNFVGEYISVTLFADYAESSHAFLR